MPNMQDRLQRWLQWKTQKVLIKNSCHELKTEHIWNELIRNISNFIYRHSRFYILSHHHHPISPFPFFHITPSPLRWQAGEFHFGSACLSIYLKLSNSNYIFQTIAENKDTIQYNTIIVGKCQELWKVLWLHKIIPFN